MAYFRNHAEPEKEHEQQFVYPVQDTDPEESEELEAWEDEEESKEARKDRYRLILAVRDLFCTLLGALCILLLLMLIISLYSWVTKDLKQSFNLLNTL